MVQNVSFREQQRQQTSFPIIPAVGLGGVTALGVKYLYPGKEMDGDTFKRNVLAGKKIEFTGDLNPAQKKTAESLAGLASKGEEA